MLFIISLRIYSRKGFGENNILKLLTNPCNENPLSISNILFGTLTIERIENSVEPNYMIGIRLGSVKELEGNAWLRLIENVRHENASVIVIIRTYSHVLWQTKVY